MEGHAADARNSKASSGLPKKIGTGDEIKKKGEEVTVSTGRVRLETGEDRERELAAGKPEVSSLFTLVFFLLYTPHLLPFCLLRIRWLI